MGAPPDSAQDWAHLHGVRGDAMRLAALSLGLLALGGCYETVERDVGPIDAPRGPCDPIGSLMVCADECGGAIICRDSS